MSLNASVVGQVIKSNGKWKVVLVCIYRRFLLLLVMLIGDI